MQSHVIIGAGPVARATASELLARGKRVRSVTRTGGGELPAGVERVKADASHESALIEATEGAATIYNCANPPYHRWDTEWPPINAAILAAAERHGSVLVTMGNLYGYGPGNHPFVETDPLAATGTKGKVRAAMWEMQLAAHRAGRVRVTEARASDFIGPWVLSAALGERVVPRILAGKSVSLMGHVDMAHAVTAMNDVGIAMAILGNDERALGRAWHVPTAPARTQRELVDGLCAAAGVNPVKIKRLGPAMLKIAGVFVPMIRGLQEVQYQFTAPFDLDSSDFTATFDVKPTPLDHTFESTVAWYRSRRPEVARPAPSS